MRTLECARDDAGTQEMLGAQASFRAPPSGRVSGRGARGRFTPLGSWRNPLPDSGCPPLLGENPLLRLQGPRGDAAPPKLQPPPPHPLEAPHPDCHAPGNLLSAPPKGGRGEWDSCLTSGVAPDPLHLPRGVPPGDDGGPGPGWSVEKTPLARGGGADGWSHHRGPSA